MKGEIDGGKIVTWIFIFFVVVAMIGLIGLVFQEERARNSLCNEYEMAWNCNAQELGCRIDCEENGLLFSKYNNGGFGSSSCWCNDAGEIKRIW